MDRTPVVASRLYAGQTALALSLLLSVVLALSAAVQAEGRLPDGVPDLLNPRVLASWQPYLLGNLEGNPDFPLVLYVNESGSAPAAVVMAIDARNGASTWSLASDPVIVIAVFADPQTVTRLYYDQGFAKDGRASGQYGKIAQPDSATLPALLGWVLHLQRLMYM